jgi:hypothetical protein
MKHITILLAIILSFKAVSAQQPSNQIKISLKDKKNKFIEINALNTSLYVEGYDGDEIIIEPYNVAVPTNIPAEAGGLRNITALTNQVIPIPVEKITPSIKEFPQAININISETNCKALLIKVPKAIHLKLQYVTKLPDDELSLKNLSGELELSGNAPLTEINNISGPVTLTSRSTSRSKIKISNIKWNTTNTDKSKFLLYLGSSADDFDISLPDDLKATLGINLAHGDIYSDLNLVPKFPESSALNYFKGELNGGGVNIIIITEYGNVFIRKQK